MMRRFYHAGVLAVLMPFLFACSTTQPMPPDDLSTPIPVSNIAVVDKVVDESVDKSVAHQWSVTTDQEPLTLSHQGIPGNYAHFPNTLVGEDELLTLILGDPYDEGTEVVVRIIGSHQFFDTSGLTTTLISVPAEERENATDLTQKLSLLTSLEELEQLIPGALIVIEAGLVRTFGKSGVTHSRSLGFRTAAPSVSIFNNARLKYDASNLRATGK